jgi:hypothetical protein
MSVIKKMSWSWSEEDGDDDRNEILETKKNKDIFKVYREEDDITADDDNDGCDNNRSDAEEVTTNGRAV